MDSIGQMNLKLAELAGQKYMGQAQALQQVGGLVKRGVSELEKMQVDKALSGDFNTIAEQARAKGVDDNALNVAASLWNASPNIEDRKKLLSGLHLMVERKNEEAKLKAEKEKVETRYAGLSGLVQEELSAPTQGLKDIDYSGNYEEQLNNIYANKALRKEDRQKRISKIIEGIKNPEELNYVQDLISTYGKDEGMYEEKALFRLRDQQIRREIAAERANAMEKAASLRRAIKDNPKALPGTTLKEVEYYNYYGNEAQRLLDSFNDSYAGNVPFRSLAELGQSYDKVFSKNLSALTWWGKLNKFMADSRHKLFGSAFTATEAEFWKQISVTPNQAPEHIRKFLNALADEAANKINDTYDLFSKSKINYDIGILDRSDRPGRAPEPGAGGGEKPVEQKPGDKKPAGGGAGSATQKFKVEKVTPYTGNEK